MSEGCKGGARPRCIPRGCARAAQLAEWWKGMQSHSLTAAACVESVAVAAASLARRCSLSCSVCLSVATFTF